MLGLKQFSTPHFIIPDTPATERPLHKMKDFLSFLNSLQWKVKEKQAKEEEDDEPLSHTESMDAGDMDSLTKGLDWSLGNPFTGKKLGNDGIEDMSISELRDKANDSLVHGGAINFGTPLEYDESVYTPKVRTQPLSKEDEEMAENFGKTIDDLWYNAVRKGKSDAYWNGAPFMTPEGRL